jgi:hypothetical protein
MGAFGYPASIDFDDVGNRTFRMPRRYSNGGRVNPGAADRMPGGPPLPDPRTLKERFGALGNLRPFLAMVWRTSPSLTMASLALRLVRALLPVATLFVGKLIIDEVVLLVQTPDKPGTFQAWLDSGLANRLGVLLLIEFALAVLADVLGRVVSLLDSLLSERVSNVSSVRLGEAHYNAQGYSLDYGRTPERRELDYVRQTTASVETAKEVKIFGLNGFLIERYRSLAAKFYAANRRLALRRASWGGVLTAIGTIGYYLAYAYIAWRTLAGEFTIGDLTFLAGSFRRLRNLLEGLLSSFPAPRGKRSISTTCSPSNGRRSPLREPICARPTCSFSTSRLRPWTRAPNSKCSAASRN